MKQFRSKITGAILTPSSDLVIAQMEKSPDFEIVDPNAPAQGNTQGDGKTLSRMNKNELLAAAQAVGVEVPDGATKNEIIALIEAAQGNTQGDDGGQD